MRITVRQLEIFAAICQEQTITGAAAKIGLSQAATSQALAELENLLERKLFDRHGRRVVLNAAGRELFPEAVQVLDHVRGIEGKLPHSRSLRLWASLTAGNYLLPPVISRFRRSYPHVRFRVDLGNTDQVVESLIRFESDAGWTEGRIQHPDLKEFPWREDELGIICAPDHRLAGRKASIEDLADEAWVLREKGSGTRAIFESAIAGKFRPASVPVELGGIEAIKSAVRAGAGLGCISLAAIAFELRTKQLRRVHAPWLDLRRRITVLVHGEKYLDSMLRGFLVYCGVQLPPEDV